MNLSAFGNRDIGPMSCGIIVTRNIRHGYKLQPQLYQYQTNNIIIIHNIRYQAEDSIFDNALDFHNSNLYTDLGDVIH